jgi:hypothetical protein
VAKHQQIEPPHWSADDLERHRQRAIENFRRQRMEEPLEKYLEEFEECQRAFYDLLESTGDLTQLSEHAVAVLSDQRLLDATRYLAAPPISVDDLKISSDVPTLAPKRLRADPALAQRLIETVRLGLDRQRFPWLREDRDPTEEERRAAVLASAVVLASQRVATSRRSESKTGQENRVEEALLGAGFTKVATRTVSTSAEGPKRGEFCRESVLTGRKADLLVGLWDTRLMPIECKVSNSATNSIKRLNNDAAVKAVSWRRSLGEANVVPTAVLSGVYKLKNLVDAEEKGLTLFWAHDLVKLTDWISSTRCPG